MLPIFISTILQSVRKENLAHYFPYDVKLRLLADSRSFLANQKARNAIVGAENLLKRHTVRPGYQAWSESAPHVHVAQMAPISYSKYLLFGLPIVALAGLAALWWERKEKRRSYKEVGRVSDLFIYPVKSCKGIRVNDIKCFKEGMEYDR